MCACLNHWLQWISIIIPTIGLIITIRQFNKQQKIKLSADYTKRYQDIILHFPENINDKGFTPDQDKKWDTTLRHMRVYFDLCYEEYSLKKDIGRRHWEDWQHGIKSACSKPAFQLAWHKIQQDTHYSQNYINWIDSFITNNAL